MADQAGTIEILARELALALAPLAPRATPDAALTLFADLGLEFPPQLTTNPDVVSALSATASMSAALSLAIDQLTTAIEAGDRARIIAQGIAVLDALQATINSFTGLASAILALSGSLPGMAPNDVIAFANALPDHLLEDLLVTYLEIRSPGIESVLAFSGVIEHRHDPGVDGDPTHPPFIVKRLHLDRLSKLIALPGELAQTLYGWGSPSFDGNVLLQALSELLAQFAVPFQLTLAAGGVPPSLQSTLFDAVPFTSGAPRGLALTSHIMVNDGFDLRLPLGMPGSSIHISVQGQFPTELQATLTPPSSVALHPPNGILNGVITAAFEAKSPDPTQGLVLVGQTGGSRLQATSVNFSAALTATWDSSSGHAVAETLVKFEVIGGKVVIDLSSGDGFISTLLSGTNLSANLDFKLQWSLMAGASIEGSSSIDIAIPMHVTLGPVDIQKLYLKLGPGSDGSLPAELSTAFQASLGPLQASVDRIGLNVTTTFPARGGNLGPANLAFSFKPPSGVGLSVNVGIVQGGGFLYIDTDRGEYAGALELVFADFLSLHAIGLITTKMPDGSSGFSLLVIITADFGTGIQLGFGFTLLAVGGLVGLNRTMLLQPLMNGVRTGAIDSIMFPQNVVANAPRIISDLRAIFPPQQGIFLLGPMAKLGWGEPTLVSLALGVIIEIPGDIAILGVLKLALPADDIAVIMIQVNFAGAIEFDKKRMYFFASLFNSRVLFITIEGEMGVLFAFGDDANFVVSVGGFHPQYTPPPLPFPSPRRIEIDIINESFARIRCDGYFAVTSDSVQFGAHAEMFFGFSALSVSGHVSFDALIQFSPFHFVVSFSASFSVQVFGMGVYGIDIAATLEGPTPWHAHGSASISFFFFSIGVNIDVTWGDSRDTSLPPIAVMPLLAGEFSKQSNWRAALPDSSHLLVTLRKLGEAESAFVLHPVGTLRISQRAVPLDLTLDKVGNEKPNDANRFALTVSSVGLTKTAELQEQFAPSQFQNFDDATKLSQPGYEPLDSGIELSAAGTSLASGTAITRVVRYDLTVIDTKYRSYAKRFFSQAGALFNHFLGGASVTKCALSAYRAAQMQPVSVKVAVGPETFAVALRSNNTVFSAEAVAFTSQAAAHDYLNRAMASNPSLAGTLHVLPQFEVAA
jgi:hypothetical protein